MKSQLYSTESSAGPCGQSDGDGLFGSRELGEELLVFGPDILPERLRHLERRNQWIGGESKQRRLLAARNCSFDGELLVSLHMLDQSAHAERHVPSRDGMGTLTVDNSGNLYRHVL